VLCRVLADGVAAGAVDPGPAGDDRTLESDLAERLGLPAGLAGRAVLAWSSLFGTISFELFGQTHNVVADHAAHFDRVVEELAALAGLPE
jgi:hypothetical protein